MTGDALNGLGQEIRRACGDANVAAQDAGDALVRARSLVGWADWDSWLTQACGLSAEEAQLLMDRALDRDEDPSTLMDALPGPQEAVTVVCGWCERPRADQGLPPKHVAGPENSPRVAHGVCGDCNLAVNRLLDRFRRPPPPSLDLPAPPTDGATCDHPHRPPPVPHAQGWALACDDLRRAFFHVDQATEAARVLQPLAGVGVDGVGVLLAQLADSLDRLTRLAAELVLISHGEDYDDDAFSEEEAP
ncbi:MAG TPA: hypothetical protein DEA08_03325 [Planctomycetes bacterium]|nr:hypothetical protein [Planctomycetota bacterium]